MSTQNHQANVSRRAFLAGVGAGAMMITGAPMAFATEADGTITTENPFSDYDDVLSDFTMPAPPEVEPPAKTEYECDVLVIGSGYAGMHAAMCAKEAGKSVVVVDKGKPGYSGCSPFAHSTAYFDPELDDMNAILRAMPIAGEYVLNLEQIKVIIEGTKEAFEQNDAWGICGGAPMAPSVGITDSSQLKEYYQTYVLGNDRHARETQLFDENGIEWIADCMITDLVTVDGRVTGAIGFHVKSSTVITFKAKAVCMCTGAGVIKEAGYANGGNSFDGDYMAYKLGLTLVGQEFDDFHQTSSYAPGDYFYSDTWDYAEPIAVHDAFFNIEDSDEAAVNYAAGKSSFMVINRIKQTWDGLGANDGTGLKYQASHGASETDPNDPRVKYMEALGGSFGRNKKHDIYGVAPGMNAHMCAGVYCGWDDHDGKTPYPGLYVAGDGIQGDMLLGCQYAMGLTSHGCSAQGNRCGRAAAAYADTVDFVDIPQEQIDNATAEIFSYKNNTTGFDPNWVVDYLQTIMLNPLVHIAPTKASLEGALLQVEYLRDTCLPKMTAFTGHDIRIALEAKSKVFHAEAKIRAKLYREESRGMHYRSDFPYRDDENFLCHVGVLKGEDGSITCEKIDIPDSWKGDTSKPYTERYVWRFPGEAEALGIEDEGLYEDQDVRH